MTPVSRKLFPILVNYPEEGDHGLLGPQMAATIITNYTEYESLVIGIGHDFNPELLKSQLLKLLPSDKPIVGFSYLGGRSDLWRLARQLRQEGITTILAGPQSNVDFLGEVGWETHPHRFAGLRIGCPYAVKKKLLEIDYPTDLNDKPFPKKGKIPLTLQGCSFCDVARDKGFGLALSTSTVLRQIARLPEDEEGRKIPFELVNENSVASLAPLLSAIKESQIRISRIDLVTRADWLLKAEPRLREALKLAKFLKVQILLAAVGFESFTPPVKGPAMDLFTPLPGTPPNLGGSPGLYTCLWPESGYPSSPKHPAYHSPRLRSGRVDQKVGGERRSGAETIRLHHRVVVRSKTAKVSSP